MKSITGPVHRLVVAASVGLVAAAGVALTAAAETTLERVKREGFVRVGFANEAPFAYATTEGKLTGEAVEVARNVLAKLGVTKLDGVLTEWASLIPGLRAGRFDIITAGMFVLPKRCEQVSFSEPTYGLGQSFVVRTGNPKNLHSYEDVKNHPDAKLAVTAGAVERDYAQDVGVPDDRVLVFSDPPTGLAAVQTGRVDAYALTSLSIQNLVTTAGPDAGVERAKPFTDPIIEGKSVTGYGAFAFRKEDEDFLEEFNKHLTAFVGTPEHLATVEPFGFTESELPGGKKTADLCAGK